MVVPKKSPYKSFLWAATLQVKEKGQRDFLVSRFAVRRPHCKATSGSSVALGFEKIFTLFLLMGTGMMVSIIILVMECLLPLQHIATSHEKSSNKGQKIPTFEKEHEWSSNDCCDDIDALVKATASLRRKIAAGSNKGPGGECGVREKEETKSVVREIDRLLLAMEALHNPLNSARRRATS